MDAWPVPPLLAFTLPLATSGGAGPCFAFIVLPLAQAIICWQLINAFQQIPERYRFQEPGRVWLLMVPLFNIYWNFKVFPALAESFQLYFYSRGISDVEDCGERLARWYCYLGLTWVIPCFDFATGLASLVVVILLLSEADRLKKRVLATEAA
jgi:hypothetical protein